MTLVSGTASGKTLAYNLPVLQRMLQDEAARALYLFPTKALGQDQLTALQSILEGMEDTAPARHSWAAIYDGDTPTSQRSAIRAQARLVFSNPDMLHTAVLPHHTRWIEFFSHLAFIVIDEMHVYRGVFGSHVANVLRRITRVARFYGASPQYILTSATIANPAELAERLVEAPVRLIDEDGSPRGPRHFLVYNPPVVDKDLGLRRSSMQEAVRLAGDLLAYQVQTILFTRTRRSVEIVLTYLRSQALIAGAEHPVDPQKALRGYRSGYLPAQRREIERGLRSGQVRAVVATNALELGIDIGSLGAALLVGYPGTIAATRQQAGRAGRGEQAAMAVFIATADPLDQFLARHPEYLTGRTPEQALINPDHLLILLEHLRCAAFELSFKPGEGFGRVPPDLVHEYLDFLVSQGSLHNSGGSYFWMADQYPAQGVSLRSASSESVVLQVSDALYTGEAGAPVTTLGQIDVGSAPWMVHPQAIYLHEGQSFAVESLDLEQNIASLKLVESDYYTQPLMESTVALIEQQAQEQVPGGDIARGEIRVTTLVKGFRKIRWYTHETLGTGELNLPPSELQTTGYWLALDDNTVASLQEQGLWSNTPNDYGPEWRRLREVVRARDGFRCQSCGAPENGRTHDVHHKIPFRFFEYPADANRLENLVTLCQVCHRRVETAVRMRSGLAGLGYILGQLAPLFLMCDPGDLGMHTDPQLSLAGGKPGVVLYDHIPAGLGFSQRLFELHATLVQRAAEQVAACDCSDGCPACVGPGGENGLGGKRET